MTKSLLYPVAYLDTYCWENTWIIEYPQPEIFQIRHWWLLLFGTQPNELPKMTMVTLRETNGKEEKQWSKKPGFHRAHAYVDHCKYSTDQMKGGILMLGPQPVPNELLRAKLVQSAYSYFPYKQFVELVPETYLRIVAATEKYLIERKEMETTK